MIKTQIWIIDDNPVDSYVIKTMLEINEIAKNIHVFTKNEEAIEQLNAQKISDSNSPIHIFTENKTNFVDGWNLVEEMLKVNKNVKFHIISEKYDAQDLRKFKNTSSVLSLNVKPLRLDDLKNIIEH